MNDNNYYFIPGKVAILVIIFHQDFFDPLKEGALEAHI